MDPLLSKVTLRDAGTALLDLAMPRHCVACRRPLGLRERFLCLECQADFPFTHFWERSHNPMADKFNALIQKDLDALSVPSISADPIVLSPTMREVSLPPSSPDPNTSTGPSSSVEPSPSLHEPYAFAAALFFYNADSDYRHIPWHLKYEGGLAAGRFFARMLGERLAGSPQFADVDIVIPVPLHWTRRWRRGYNQAEVIARELADVLGADLRTDILRRARRTRSQVRLAPDAKAANVRGAFALRGVPPLRDILPLRGVPLPQSAPESGLPCGQTPAGSPQKQSTLRADTRRVPPKTAYPAGHVLLVDDTFTTGSTVNACRAVLRQALPLPTRISVATLAYVSSE